MQPIGDPVPGWTTRESPSAVTLEGRYVQVRPLTSAHYAELFDQVCGVGDDDLWTYLRAERPANLPALWMHLAERQQDDPATYSIWPEGAGPAGTFSLLNAQPEHGSVEIGWVLLGRALQRTRAATEAMYLMARHVFDDLGYRRYEWKCDALNAPSRRAAERLGFVYEGTFRQHQVYKGRNRDTAWFALIDADWPEVRARLERWLDPANFDGAGRQGSPLGGP